jgi:glycerophosphoryl diester phosphodiesterase
MSLRRWIYHLQWPRMKHEENSIRGIRRAARAGYRWIDLDLQMTSDGVIVVTHWARPMRKDRFRDPLRRIYPGTPVSRLTWAQVRRLKTGDGYRIPRIEAALRACAHYGIGAYLEPKGDRRFREDAPWQHIAKVADDLGTHVRVRALSVNHLALPPANRAGFETRVI